MKYAAEDWYLSCVQLVRERHGAEKDLLGRPYDQHFTRVAERLCRLCPGATPSQVQAALLHDAFEPDTRVDAEVLKAHGADQAALAIIRRVTLPTDGRPYLDYIQALCASGDRAALEVKLADNLDAVESLEELGTAEARQMLAAQYLPSRRLLEQALGREAAD